MRARFCQLEQRYCLISSLCSSYRRSMRLTVGWDGNSIIHTGRSDLQLFLLTDRSHSGGTRLQDEDRFISLSPIGRLL
jgi:hypothetical protein